MVFHLMQKMHLLQQIDRQDWAIFLFTSWNLVLNSSLELK